MKRLSFLFFVFAALLAGLLPGNPAHACAPNEAIISTESLAQHLLRGSPLTLVDIRDSSEYATGHIPNSVNIPFAMPVSAWVSLSSSGLLMELPNMTELAAVLGAAGISQHSRIVLVNNTASPGVPPSYPLAQTTRVAVTLLHAGVNHVSILDGGFTKWSSEGRALSADPVSPAPVSFRVRLEDFFVSKQYVADSLGMPRKTLIDARDTDVYNGTVIEPYAPIAGHIPGAKSLPAPSIWNEDGTYKSATELRALATAAIGTNPSKEIIVYCGVGGYASPWWFVLTQLLGYSNVKFYDGSAQEWTAEPAGPME